MFLCAAAAETSVGELEAGLAEAGVQVPRGASTAVAEADNPLDVWAPAVQVPEGQAFQVRGAGAGVPALGMLHYVLSP